MRLDALKKRLTEIETSTHSGKIKSTDDEGKEAWIKGSGLKFLREIMRLERNLGRDARLEDLPEDLQREARLWSRAELPGCGLSDMLKSACERLM